MKVKNKTELLSIFLAIVMLFSSVKLTMFLNDKSINNDDTNQKLASEENSEISQNNYIKNDSSEMKAVWVPYMSLDLKDKGYSENSFKENFDYILNTSKEYGINTLIVQVRPFSDALYPSNVFPWSHLLTGTQGVSPGFDPLDYMINKTHSSDMQFHAWINPFRIQSKETPSVLSSENLYNVWRNDSDKSNDDWVIDWENCKYYNPAYTEVQAKIIDGVKEIVENYNIDGIQFDDYFYPTTSSEYDKNAYDNYCSKITQNGEALSLTDWRLNNINSLVSGVYRTIKSINPNVQFGISPQCNTTNDINMGADIYTWGSVSGYVDYICPQIYVNFEHAVLPFDKSINEWKNIVTCDSVKLYIGLAVYKAGSSTADNGSWLNSNDILKKQIEYSRNIGCNGFMLYSFEYIKKDQTKQEIENVMNVL